MTGSTQTGENDLQCSMVSSSSDYCNPRPRNSRQVRLNLVSVRYYRDEHTSRNPWNPLYPQDNMPQPVAPSFRSEEILLPRVIGSTRSAAVYVVIIAAFSLLALTYVYMNFPELEKQLIKPLEIGGNRPLSITAIICGSQLQRQISEQITKAALPEERQHIKLPWDIEDAKQLGRVLDRYKSKYYIEVLSGVFVIYIFLQTFAIPGSLFLSILSGFLFPFPLALLLVCFCSAFGASLCYLLSQLLGRRIVYKYFPERAQKWAVAVNKHRGNIFNYILFLRMTPFLPNWFINLTAPVIGVPLVPFAFGTFFGVAPPSFVAIQAGKTLHKLTSSSDAWSWTSVILLAVFAFLSLVPVLLKQRLKKKLE